MSFPLYQKPKPAQVARARAMRRAMTEAERRLWRALRRRLSTYHFRRQMPIGGFIVDFCCLGSRLVIEVDGNQHGFDRQRAHDVRRTKVLETAGFHVIRFANEDVFRAMDSVIDTIFAHLEGKADTFMTRLGGREARLDPHPNPSPQGGGEAHVDCGFLGKIGTNLLNPRTSPGCGRP